MNKYSVLTSLFAATVASNGYGATGNLVVFDDADENGFNHAGASCSNGSFFGETVGVHSGAAAVAISKQTDNNGAGWLAPTIYSTSSDYDGVTFWVNSGSNQSLVTSLLIFDMDSNIHFLHLEDLYGAKLPANTWIQFQVPFASPFFETSSSAPATVQTLCVITHSASGVTNDFLYLDDVTLNGADIFKNGFDN